MDDRRTKEAYLSYKLANEPSAQVSYKSSSKMQKITKLQKKAFLYTECFFDAPFRTVADSPSVLDYEPVH